MISGHFLRGLCVRRRDLPAGSTLATAQSSAATACHHRLCRGRRRPALRADHGLRASRAQEPRASLHWRTGRARGCASARPRAEDRFRARAHRREIAGRGRGSGACRRRDARGIHFFIVDAPAEAFKPLADAIRGRDVLVFNATAADDTLRRNLCAARDRAHAAEPGHGHGRARAISGLAQVEQPSRLRGAAAGGRGHGQGVREFSQEVRRARRRAPTVQARHRSARAREERSRRC